MCILSAQLQVTFPPGPKYLLHTLAACSPLIAQNCSGPKIPLQLSFWIQVPAGGKSAHENFLLSEAPAAETSPSPHSLSYK